jgi:predicted amidohydrolase
MRSIMKESRRNGKIGVTVLQPRIIEEEDKKRLARVQALLTEGRGTDLILLPELWRVGYSNFASYRERAEALAGGTVSFLQGAAREERAYLLGGSFIERDHDHLYNTAVLLDRNGEIIGIYRKSHLLSYRSQERDLLTPGNELTVIETPIGTLGIAICYDLRFPEIFRAMSESGVEVFLVPAAWPITRMEAWEALCRARAVENQAYIIACNAVGERLLGHSMVVDPWGVKIASLGSGEGVLQTSLDLARLRRFREEFPVWRER